MAVANLQGAASYKIDGVYVTYQSRQVPFRCLDSRLTLSPCEIRTAVGVP